MEPLHVATSIIDLEANANKTVDNIKKVTGLKKVTKMLYQESQLNPLDEERTYIFLLRFMKAYEYLLSSSPNKEKKQVKLLLGKEANKASTQLPILRSNLIKRYDETAKSKEVPVEVLFVAPARSVKKAPIFGNTDFVSCSQLNKALHNLNHNILIIDSRKTDDFNSSKIKEADCINIPEDIIRSGLSSHTLEAHLPQESLDLWKKRDSYDVIVLMDWSTNRSNYAGSRVDKLRTILLEWDIQRTYNEQPVMLNNGYSEWIEMYPTLCTADNVRFIMANAALDELLSDDNFEYPSAKSKNGDIQQASDAKSLYDELDMESTVMQQKEKVAHEITKQEVERKNIHNKMADEYNIGVIQMLKIAEKEAADVVSKLRKQETGITDKNIHVVQDMETKVTPSVDTSESLDSDSIKAQQEILNRQRLLELARQAKKPTSVDIPNIDIPTIDRATKPKLDIKPLDGIFKSVKDGLTGLVNIKNTCYLNTIIQCIRHLPNVMHYYCTKDFKKELVRTQPVISTEIAQLVGSLWANTHLVIRPSQFYNKFTLLSPTYKAGNHEDCMEFFLTLLTYLSEDCASEISPENCWSETEIVWYKQHAGKRSFFIDTFYHQIKTVHTCPQCNAIQLRYEIENVFYLNIPNRKFHLEDCMNAYFHDTTKFRCKQCQKVKNVQRSLCRYPRVIVIVLKRHIQTGHRNNVAVFKKNESCCFFPIDHFVICNRSYSLKAVALHVGTTESGHYTAVCYNPINAKWYLFNDETVHLIDITSADIGIKAYAFFYSRDDNEDIRS